MDRYYTVMFIPEQKKKVVSFRIPRPFFRLLSFLFAVLTITLIILAYDYKQVLDQIYENKYLSVENRKLRDQLNIFQMKINTLSNDIQRIHIFEKKLRIITGIENLEISQEPSAQPDSSTTFHDESKSPIQEGQLEVPGQKRSFAANLQFEKMDTNKNFIQLNKLYQKKMAEDFGFTSSYNSTKTWSEISKRSFLLANQFAIFDFKYNQLKYVVKNLEVEVHEIDQYLLDKESFIKSTPTILPTKGWITSYYGPRTSPYSGRLKMHEGLDIGAQIGTNIVAPADGVITFSGHRPGFGNFVQIDHGYGLETIYGHAQTLRVRNGQKVQRGNLIAQVGNTGLSTGPHVHYEVRVNGIAVDPLYFILD